MLVGRGAEQESQRWQAHFNAALVALHLGATTAAAAAATRMVEDADASVTIGPIADGLRGAMALHEGDPTRAAEHLSRWWAAVGNAEKPSTWPHLADLAEALVGAGELDRAEVFLDEAQTALAAGGRRSLHAELLRARAMLTAARGDLDVASALVDEALGLHGDGPDPFARARTLLAKGQLCRRGRQKLAARDALTEALVTFAALGAEGWRQRTTAELARVNIRPAAPLELTATERRVAELAARGMTNREIAAAAFLSPKTVEANLSRAYRKLGIGSRSELGMRLANQGPSGPSEGASTRNETRGLRPERETQGTPGPQE